MKKRVLSQIALFLALLAGLLFTGCENFLNGDEIKDAVVEAIQYGNAPYYSIRVEAVKGSGTIKGNEEVSKRVSDTFTIRFEPEDDHQFIRWEASIPGLGSGESVSDYIFFEDAESLETNVTLKKANNNILIRPVCPAKLHASINLSDPDIKYPRDSIIALTFTEEISEESLSFISINISNLPEGKTFQDYYNPPVKSGNIVIFNPKIDWENVNENDLIPMEETELKTISVTLPANKIFYENTDYSTNIVQHLEKDTKFSFTINSDINKAPYVDVYFEGSHGKFYPAKGRYTVKQFQKNQIEYEPDSDYGFIRWQIYNTATNEEIPDGLYIKIEDPDAEKTSYTLVNLPENTNDSQQESEGEEESEEQEENEDSNLVTLSVRPVVCERPQVISYTPSYSSDGTYRDSTIQVMFDYDMDENSIYYSDIEMGNMILQGIDFNKFLSTTVRGETKYYGYQNDDGTVVFKNISIINSRNNANIADHFTAPVFETPRSLSIRIWVEDIFDENGNPVLENGQQKQVTHSLSPGMNVLVTIEKDFFRTVDEKPVSMSQAKKWLYLVNGTLDDRVPTFTNIKVYDSAGTEIDATATAPTSSSVNTLKFFKGGTFKLALKAHDNVAPSANFVINLKKIFNASYEQLSTPVTYRQSKEFSACYGTDGVYGNEDTGELVPVNCTLSNLEDGVYGLSITIKDGSGNESKSTQNITQTSTEQVITETGNLYYFILDSTKPAIAAPTVEDLDDATKLKLNWGTVSDYQKAVIKWRKWGSTILNSSTQTGHTYTITNLTPGTRYEIIAEYYDYAGNVTTAPVANGAYTRPKVPQSVSLSATYGASTTISASKPDTGNCTNIRIRYKVNGSSSWTEFSGRIDDNNESQTITPAYGYKYDIEVSSYDQNSGKYSVPYYTTGTTLPSFITPPNAPTLNSCSSVGTTKFTVNWAKASSGNTDGYIVYISTTSNFSSSTTTSYPITSASTVSKEITGLTQGKLYYYYVKSYYGNQSNTTSSTSSSVYTQCAAVTNLSANSTSNSSIYVNWTAPAGEYSSYRLYYKKSSETVYSYVNPNKGSTSYSLTGLAGGDSYDIKLETRGAVTSQSNSVEKTGIKTRPNPVVNFSAIKVTGSSTNYTVKWSKPSSGAYDGYKLYIASSLSALSTVGATATYNSSNESSGVVTLNRSATANSLVYVKVSTYRTVDSQTLETFSESVCCSLALDPVTNLKATVLSKTEIKLTWTNPSGADNFKDIKIYKESNTTPIATLSKTATSYNVTGLSPNSRYNFTVRTTMTVNGGDRFAEALVTSPYTLSNPITSASATAAGPTSVSLNWTYPTSGTYDRVNIYRGDTYVDYWSTTTEANYSVPTGGTAYTFKFITRNSNYVENTSEPKTCSVTTPASPVTNLKMYSNTPTSITLQWTNPSGNYTGVKVYYKSSSSTSWSSTPYATYTNGSTTCTISNLTAGTNYDFKVQSYYSSIPEVGTSSTATITYVKTKPNAPTNFALSSRTTSSLTYSWSKPSGIYDGFILCYKKSSDSTYTEITLGSSKTSYTVSNLAQGTSYTAYIKSYYSDTTNYSYTNSISKTTTPGAPQSPSVVTTNDGGTKVSWSAPSNGVSGYYVYYRISSSSSWSSVYTTDTYYTFSNSSLTGGGLYYFYVTTYLYSNSDYLYSAQTSTVSKYAPPTSLSFSTTPYIYQDDAMGSITLRWTNTTGRSDITGIIVYYDDVSYTSVDFTNGSTQTANVKISNYSRGSSHYFRFQPYHKKNGTSTSYWAYGPKYSLYLGTSSGNLVINGTSYDYSKLVNVITSQACYEGTSSETHPDGAFYKNRKVYLSPYSMGAYEVTQQLYKAVMGSNPASTNYNRDAVNNVNYYHAIAFCNKLSVMHGLTPCYTISGYSNSYWGSITHSDVPTSNNETWNSAYLEQLADGYRLPTECQHEFAARGGNPSYSAWNYSYPGSNTLTDVAWVKSNSSNVLQYVGLLPSNRLGLYDMSGNVTEWLSDWNYNPTTGTYMDPYCGYSTSNSSGGLWSSGLVSYRSTLSKKEAKVLKKGGWYGSNDNAWVDSNGDKWGPWNRDVSTGFRLCRMKTYQ